MADQLLVSTEALAEGSQKYDRTKSEVLSCLDGMRNAVAMLQGNWVGTAGNAFFQTFETLCTSLRHTEALLEDVAVELKMVSALTEETESGLGESGARVSSLLDSI